MSKNISQLGKIAFISLGQTRGRGFLLVARWQKIRRMMSSVGGLRADVVQWSANEMWFTINQKIVKFPSPYQQRLRLFIKSEGDILHGRVFPLLPTTTLVAFTRHFHTTPLAPNRSQLSQPATTLRLGKCKNYFTRKQHPIVTIDNTFATSRFSYFYIY